MNYWVLVPFYRGAVVFNMKTTTYAKLSKLFSSPFIEERLYLYVMSHVEKKEIVLVPFYRGAVVFLVQNNTLLKMLGSRPLLSRSGCI